MSTRNRIHESLYGSSHQAQRTGAKAAKGMKAIILSLEGILDNSFIPKPGRLLEIGCGAGEAMLRFLKLGWDAHGVDSSQKTIDKTRAKHADAKLARRFRVGDARELKGIRDESFVMVVDCHCLHSLIGEDRQRCLKSAFRVLKPGGCLLLHTMCGPHVGESVKGYDEESRCQVVKGEAVRFFGRPNEISEEIEAAGFMIARRELHDATEEGGQDRLLFAALKPLIEGNQFPVAPGAKKPKTWSAGRRWTKKEKKD